MLRMPEPDVKNAAKMLRTPAEMLRTPGPNLSGLCLGANIVGGASYGLGSVSVTLGTLLRMPGLVLSALGPMLRTPAEMLRTPGQMLRTPELDVKEATTISSKVGVKGPQSRRSVRVGLRAASVPRLAGCERQDRWPWRQVG